MYGEYRYSNFVCMLTKGELDLLHAWTMHLTETLDGLQNSLKRRISRLKRKLFRKWQKGHTTLAERSQLQRKLSHRSMLRDAKKMTECLKNLKIYLSRNDTLNNLDPSTTRDVDFAFKTFERPKLERTIEI